MRRFIVWASVIGTALVTSLGCGSSTDSSPPPGAKLSPTIAGSGGASGAPGASTGAPASGGTGAMAQGNGGVPATGGTVTARSGGATSSGNGGSSAIVPPGTGGMNVSTGGAGSGSGGATLGTGGSTGAAGAAGAGGSTGADPIIRDPNTMPTADDLNKNGKYMFKSYTIPRGTNFGGATVYYPTDADAPWSYAAFCPPYTATQVAFAAWGPFFASHGIVLATMDSVTTGDYPPQRAQGLEELMGILKNEATKSGSPLMGKINPNRAGVLGWSMGGGGVWIASGKHPEWKSAVTLAGHNITATGWDASAKMSTIPTMMLNGATDTTILGGMNQTPNAYMTIPDTTPKLMYIMSDLGHFDWGTPAAEGNAAGRYVMAWEKYYLDGDSRYKQFFIVKGPNAATWQTNVQ